MKLGALGFGPLDVRLQGLSFWILNLSLTVTHKRAPKPTNGTEKDLFPPMAVAAVDGVAMTAVVVDAAT